jgi:hypothetical protein
VLLPQSAAVPNTLPLALACGLYLWQAVNYAVANQYGMAVGFVAYALANVGFIIAARGI